MVRRPSARARRLQWVLLLGLVVLVGLVLHNAAGNLAARHLGFSYDYLWAPANFDIPFHLLSWATNDSYGRVLLVGLCNTLLVTVFGIIAATLLGLVVGIMRLSVNWLLRQLAACFVEIIRNTPQLIQIVFWYVAVLQSLPGPRQSIVIPPGILLNVRGLYVPRPLFSDGAAPLLIVAAVLLLAGIAVVWRRKWRWSWLIPAAFVLAAAPIQHLDWPVVGGFNVRGGAVLAPGTIPPSVNPPAPAPAEVALTAEPAMPTSRIAAVTQPDKASLVSSMRKVGTTGALAANATAPQKPTESRTAAAAHVAKPGETKVAAAHPPIKPATSTPAAAPSQTAMVSGAQPIVSTNSFDSRFSAVK